MWQVFARILPAGLPVVLPWIFQSGELRTSRWVKRCGRRSIRPLKMQIKACQNEGQLWSDFYRRLAA